MDNEFIRREASDNKGKETAPTKSQKRERESSCGKPLAGKPRGRYAYRPDGGDTKKILKRGDDVSPNDKRGSIRYAELPDYLATGGLTKDEMRDKRRKEALPCDCNWGYRCSECGPPGWAYYSPKAVRERFYGKKTVHTKTNKEAVYGDEDGAIYFGWNGSLCSQRALQNGRNDEDDDEQESNDDDD